MPPNMCRGIFGVDNCTVKRWYWLCIVTPRLQTAEWKHCSRKERIALLWFSIIVLLVCMIIILLHAIEWHVVAWSYMLFSLFWRCLTQKQQSSSAIIRWKSNRASPKKGKWKTSDTIHKICTHTEFSIFHLLLLFRWVEEDPKEILQSVYECMERTCEKLTQLNIDISNIKGIHTLCYHLLCWSSFYLFQIGVYMLFNLCSYWSDQPKRDHAGVGQRDRGAPLQRNRFVFPSLFMCYFHLSWNRSEFWLIFVCFLFSLAGPADSINSWTSN